MKAKNESPFEQKGFYKTGFLPFHQGCSGQRKRP
jgi:hypothetical protein